MGDFRFLTPDEISKFDLMSVADDSPTGYIIDCDLEYPSYDSESWKKWAARVGEVWKRCR